VSRGVALAPEAVADLEAIYLYILDRAGSRVVLGYVARLEAQIQSLAACPERGAPRDAIRPGLRILVFERRITIAFHRMGDMVVVDPVFRAGRNLSAALMSGG